LDNRYDFNKTSKDRLGEQQWSWLDKSLEDHNDYNLTMILAGI